MDSGAGVPRQGLVAGEAGDTGGLYASQEAGVTYTAVAVTPLDVLRGGT